MKIKIWDSHNKQWLSPMALYFDSNDDVCRISACKVGVTDTLSEGWYIIEKEDLKKVAITGEITLNPHLLPNDKPKTKKRNSIRTNNRSSPCS